MSEYMYYTGYWWAVGSKPGDPNKVYTNDEYQLLIYDNYQSAVDAAEKLREEGHPVVVWSVTVAKPVEEE